MCDSYHLKCECGKKEAEIFFGKMVLDERSVNRLFCPACSGDHRDGAADRVWDNGWVIEMNMELIQAYANTFGMAAVDLTADWIFDQGYVTWVGITPDDTERRNRERDSIQALAKTDMLAYLKAMKEWGLERERRFIGEGWRKMRHN